MSTENVKPYTPKFHVPAAEVFDSLRKHMLIDGFDHVMDLRQSRGGYFLEERTGKEYLDFFTCIASMPIGMNHPKMIDHSFIHYLGEAAVNKPSNSDIYNVEMATFVKTFFELAVPKAFTYGFFIDGGSLAVENALKVAFDWKVRRNFAKGYRSERGHQILHFDKAFHGRSGYTMSLTNTDPTKTALFPKFTWPRVVNPFQIFPADAAENARVQLQEELAVKQIKQAFADNPDDIAAIIIEPIQGEGGDNHFRPRFMQTLRDLADENDALLIFDEVQTGVGITGRMWAHEAIGVTPDILCFGKKMQVCGIITTSRIDDVADNVFHTSSRINSTWGGSLVDMVRATRYLEIIDEDGLVENAATVGKHLQNSLQALSKHDDRVSNVRGLGLFCAFDVPTSEMRTAFLKKAFQEGLLIVGSGTRSVRFRPALNVTTDLIDKGLGIISKVMSSL